MDDCTWCTSTWQNTLLLPALFAGDLELTPKAPGSGGGGGGNAGDLTELFELVEWLLELVITLGWLGWPWLKLDMGVDVNAPPFFWNGSVSYALEPISTIASSSSLMGDCC